jgi:hypothetical protein
MRSRSKWIIVALAALVAVALVVVYAKRDGRTASSTAVTGNTGITTAQSPAPRAPEPAPAPSQPPAPQAAPTSPAPAPMGSGAEHVAYDLNKLPEPVQQMLQDIVEAARSGDIEKMRPVLEESELKPMVAAGAVDDPIAFWKRCSADGEGRDVLAALLNVLSAGYARVQHGSEPMYVWPYFAEIDLSKLSPEQVVELYRVVPAAQALPMQRSGKYSYWRVGIASDGVWHYFLQ